MGANENVDIKDFGTPQHERGATNFINEAGSFANVPMHNRLNYNNLWKGVNAYFYENREGKGTLKYDFIVEPNADPSVSLVIDPIALKWSTFLMQGMLFVHDIYVHPTTQRIYIVGETSSSSFPNTLGRIYGGAKDAFVSCMEKDGTTIVWSTYLGGSNDDRANTVSVDAAGDIYVGGNTKSNNFPVNGLSL